MSSTTVARRRWTFSDADRAAYRETKRAEARDAIEHAARALLTSEGWRKWADTRATFHEYSVNNCMLIAMQSPEATQVAGFKAWQQLGRQVRKGEHAIRIMAPMVVKQRDDKGQETDETVTLFRAVSVFDISQTDGEPLPEPPCEPVTGDSHAPYIAKLESFARSIGYRVEYRPLEHVGGFCRASESLICVSTNNTSANRRVKTLIHELAHAVGVPTYKEHGRADAEVIVETAAVIVCRSIGLDTSGESIPYIAGWGEANDVAAIRRYAETVDTITRTLESAVA
ncbi:MAG TPA: ArdC family protein [Solirubrobacteraceae bacterium]|jgi:antirestriction protein ArdC|nr:ArdC family protein [Solirubrobacteraceae bacterium]